MTPSNRSSQNTNLAALLCHLNEMHPNASAAAKAEPKVDLESLSAALKNSREGRRIALAQLSDIQQRKLAIDQKTSILDLELLVEIGSVHVQILIAASPRVSVDSLRTLLKKNELVLINTIALNPVSPRPILEEILYKYSDQKIVAVVMNNPNAKGLKNV